ncbi:PucR family transcriptional regulator [Mycolicibacterium thermoresistibile]
MSAGVAGVDPGVERLVKAVAAWFLDPAGGALPRAEEAALAGLGEPFNADPVMAEEARESTRLNIRHWLATMTTAPHEPVRPTLAGPIVGVAREVIRRGADHAVWMAYHVAKDEVWRLWMQRSFELEDDPAVLARALELVFQSLSSWVDTTLDELTALIEREREDYLWQSHTQRLATVTQLLDEDPADIDVAEHRLGYRLRGAHLAAVLWTVATMPDQAALMRTAHELRRRADAPQMLAVPASASSMWLWLGAHQPLNPTVLTDAFGTEPAELDAGAVRLAVGGAGIDVDGFRRSHFEAVSAQELLLRTHRVRAAAFDDIALVHLATRDAQAASAYVGRVLGELATADPDLRETVRVYVRAGLSATAAAKDLFTHRNTVLNRLHRAQQMLPQPWPTRWLEVGVALEIDHWLRPRR